MHAFTSLLTALAFASTTTLAAPTVPAAHTEVRLTKRITDFTQSCHAYDYLNGLTSWASYDVYVGIPYNDGVGCDDISNALQSAVQGWWDPSQWVCSYTDEGNTMLDFGVGQGFGGALNDALNSMYPDIAGGFNCPDN